MSQILDYECGVLGRSSDASMTSWRPLDSPSEAQGRSGGGFSLLIRGKDGIDKCLEAYWESSIKCIDPQHSTVLKSQLWTGLHGLHPRSSCVILD